MSASPSLPASNAPLAIAQQHQPKPKPPPRLKRQHRAFVNEYVKDLNGTKAAIRAGYKRISAPKAASLLLRSPKINAEIDRLLSAQLARMDVTAESVIREIARLAFFDPRNFFNDDGSLKPITELDSDTAAALAGCEVTEKKERDSKKEDHRYTVYTKIRFADKGENLERLGRYLKLFTDRVEIPGLESLAETLRMARQRARKELPPGPDSEHLVSPVASRAELPASSIENKEDTSELDSLPVIGSDQTLNESPTDRQAPKADTQEEAG